MVGVMPRATLLRIIALAGAAVTLTGAVACGGSPPAAPDPTSTPAGTPTPTVDPTVALQAKVDAATVVPKDLGTTAVSGEERSLKLAMPCDAALDARLAASHLWIYTGGYVSSHEVLAYDPQPGSTVLAQVKGSLNRCDSWIWGGTWTMDFDAEFAVSQPAGTDAALAYCHQGSILAGAQKGTKGFLCDGYVSRGQFVATVRVVQVDKATAQKELKRVLPVLAAALVKAVPTS